MKSSSASQYPTLVGWTLILIPIFLLFFSQALHAQGDMEIKSKYIEAIVGSSDGLGTVMALYKKDTKQFFTGRLFIDPQLTFYKKSYLTVQIGNTYYTNNEVLPTPPPPYTLKRLNNSGVSKLIFSANHANDTIETLWADIKGSQNGIDIIQDVYPVDFTESGVIVFKWRVTNHTASPVNVACQYLNDIQITDPTDGTSNDGPKILTKFQYDGFWTQFPSSVSGNTLPWFYLGFVHDLPNAPSFDPGLSGMGYLNYGAPLDLIKPILYNKGDWFTLVSWVWGLTPSEQAKMNTNITIGSDNAVLLQFQGETIPAKQTMEIGRTAYGTAEYEQCVGQMFALVFYPHHLVWHSKFPKPPGAYSPDSVHIETFMVDPGPPQNTTAAANTQVTLTVSKHLTLSSDSLCMNNLGQTATKPGNVDGVFIAPGGVSYFDWWACPNPAYFCNGPVTDTLTFTAACSNCAPAFIDQMGPNIGSNECQLPIIIDCAETDINPPLHLDTLFGICDSIVFHVHDNRKTDKGLASVTWTPIPGTDTNKVRIRGPFPPIKACYFDTLDHIFIIDKLDSVKGGSYNFKFVDCIGNESDTMIVIPACQVIPPDTLCPNIMISPSLNLNPASIEVSIDDIHTINGNLFSGDRGIDSVWFTNNHGIVLPNTIVGNCINQLSFKLSVRDSLKFDPVPYCVTINASDCAGNVCSFTWCYVSSPNAVVPANSNVLALHANHPNPFSHITTFNYTLTEYGEVKLYLYDEVGKEIARIVNQNEAPGNYSVDFDGSKLPAGGYIVRLENGGSVVSRKVIIEK